MATATPITERVEPTPAAVASVATRFRDDLELLLDPGGITRRNVAVLAAWLDHDVWDLMDANDAVLTQWAAGDIR